MDVGAFCISRGSGVRGILIGGACGPLIRPGLQMHPYYWAPAEPRGCGGRGQNILATVGPLDRLSCRPSSTQQVLGAKLAADTLKAAMLRQREPGKPVLECAIEYPELLLGGWGRFETGF